MALLAKDAVLAAQDIRFEAVAVPEWGGEVRVRSMTGADRDAWEQWLLDSRAADKGARLANLRARMVAISVVDEAGQRVFADGDIEALGAKSAAALDRIFAVAQKLNAIGADDIEALAKNS